MYRHVDIIYHYNEHFIWLILNCAHFCLFCHLVQIVKWWLLRRPIFGGRGQFSTLKICVSTLYIQNALSSSWQVATPWVFARFWGWCPSLGPWKPSATVLQVEGHQFKWYYSFSRNSCDAFLCSLVPVILFFYQMLLVLFHFFLVIPCFSLLFWECTSHPSFTFLMGSWNPTSTLKPCLTNWAPQNLCCLFWYYPLSPNATCIDAICPMRVLSPFKCRDCIF